MRMIIHISIAVIILHVKSYIIYACKKTAFFFLKVSKKFGGASAPPSMPLSTALDCQIVQIAPRERTGRTIAFIGARRECVRSLNNELEVPPDTDMCTHNPSNHFQGKLYPRIGPLPENLPRSVYDLTICIYDNYKVFQAQNCIPNSILVQLQNFTSYLQSIKQLAKCRINSAARITALLRYLYRNQAQGILVRNRCATMQVAAL